jgi:ABC-type Fe3+-hydroxamate transport system substrate-binding protein
VWRTLPKNVELMPQHQDLGLQLLSRLEAVAQHADARNQQARAEDLSASMQERQNHIRDQLERLPGPAGIKACSNT